MPERSVVCVTGCSGGGPYVLLYLVALGTFYVMDMLPLSKDLQSLKHWKLDQTGYVLFTSWVEAVLSSVFLLDLSTVQNSLNLLYLSFSLIVFEHQLKTIICGICGSGRHFQGYRAPYSLKIKQILNSLTKYESPDFCYSSLLPGIIRCILVPDSIFFCTSCTFCQPP